MSRAAKEQFIVDSKGQRKGVILNLMQYRKLMQFKDAVNFSDIVKEARTILKKNPLDTNALSELLEDLEDIQYIFEHKDEETILWDKAKKELAHKKKR